MNVTQTATNVPVQTQDAPVVEVISEEKMEEMAVHYLKEEEAKAVKYSEVCGHLVRHDTKRHCGCLA